MDDEQGRGRGERFQQSIDELEARITELAERARRAGGELRARLQDEESELRRRLDEARRRLREVREASGDGLEEVRSGLERLWVDVRDAWERSATTTSRPGGSATPDAEPFTDTGAGDADHRGHAETGDAGAGHAGTGEGAGDPPPPSMRPPGTAPRPEDG